MYLRDRKKLARLMVVQEVSHRQVATAAGYKTHGHIGALVRGQKTTCSPEAAVRIARFLGVPLDDLFVTRLSTNPSHTGSDSSPTRKAS